MMRCALALALTAAGCADLASSETGAGAAVTFADGQWRPGPLPDDDGGPAIVSLTSTRPSVEIGAVGERLRAALAPGATAMILTAEPATAADLDEGAWILRAGPPEAETPDLPQIDVRAGIGLGVPPGPLRLRAVAVDGAGRVGPVAELALVAESQPVPDGTLVVSLSWRGAADLDLHVVAPDGGEAWSGDPNTWERPPPPTPVDPEAWRTGGLLDHDANAGCVRTGGPAEHVVWSVPPPSGRYLARVAARSLCGDAAAAWAVTAYRDGAPIAAAAGVALPADTLAPQGAGAGVLALELELP